MATATQTPEAPAQQQPQAESNITTERTDYVVGWNVIKGKDEKTQQETEEREATFEPVDTEAKVAALKKAIEEGRFIQSFTVTVSIPRAKNFAGIKEICPDEDEASANFNRGAKSKAINRLTKKLLDMDEDGNFTFNPEKMLKNGVLDMTEDIASESQRKVLTEEEKLDRFLAGFPENTRQMMKQAYLASRQQPGAATPALAG